MSTSTPSPKPFVPQSRQVVRVAYWPGLWQVVELRDGARTALVRAIPRQGVGGHLNDVTVRVVDLRPPTRRRPRR